MGVQGFPEAATKLVPSKTPTNQRPQSVSGGYVGQCLVPNRIRKRFAGVYLYAHVLHCFWEASSTNFEDFKIILAQWWVQLAVLVGDAAKLRKMQHILSETLVFWECWAVIFTYF